jgi:ribosomal protein S18 acetylase RimI-like enzyme
MQKSDKLADIPSRTFSVRKLTRNDYHDAIALWKNCEGMGINDVDDSLDGFSRFLDRNPNSCFAAVEDGALVGIILAGHDGRRGHIYHAAVRGDHRKRGVGTSLVKSVVAVFREIGIAKISLVAFRRNEAGNRFWENMGFTVRDDLVYRDLTLLDSRRYDT